MITRTLCFTSCGKLSVRLDQLVWSPQDGEVRTMPIEDIGIVMLESEKIEVTTACLQAMSDGNVAVVVCDRSHTPSAQLLPYTANLTSQETIEAQLAATEAVNGRLWRQVCCRKILNQAGLMDFLGKGENVTSMKILAQQMKNGDPTNCEGQAARMYFHALGPDGFRREREGEWPNTALNYGYAVLRAAVTRALVGSGLCCFRGIHHHNRYNPFCLADDIMEPYRPYVDQYIFGKVRPFDVPSNELTKEMKARLLQMLTCDVWLGGLRRPLQVALSYTTSSLAKCYLGKVKQLVLPEYRV